jgi:hypothetical protein
LTARPRTASLKKTGEKPKQDTFQQFQKPKKKKKKKRVKQQWKWSSWVWWFWRGTKMWQGLVGTQHI